MMGELWIRNAPFTKESQTDCTSVSACAGKTCSLIWSKSAKRTGRLATVMRNTPNRPSLNGTGDKSDPRLKANENLAPRARFKLPALPLTAEAEKNLSPLSSVHYEKFRTIFHR